MFYMRRVLKLYEKPILRGFIHSAGMFGSIGSACRFNGSDSDIKELHFYKNNIEITDYIISENVEETSKTKVIIQEKCQKYLSLYTTYSDDGKSKGDAYLYIPFSEEKVKCIVHNAGFKWNNYWSFSGIKIKADGDGEEEFRAGFLSNDRIGIIHVYSDHDKDRYEDFENTESFSWVRLECDAGFVRVYFSKDGAQWILFWEEKLHVQNSNKRIGYYLWTDEDRFKNWFFSNYFQLHCSETLEQEFDVKMDYYNGTHLFDRYDSFNPFLLQQHIDSRILPKSEIIQCIVRAIDNGYFTQIKLNEKYIVNKLAYEEGFDYDHDNIIYGYNQNSFYMYGYDKRQKLSFCELTFEEFEEIFKQNTADHEIMFMKYNVQPREYSLDKGIIRKQIREYLEGVDPTYREDLVISKSHRVFGIKIYDVMLNNIDKLRDRRIPYILLEHKEIMEYRLNYYQQRCLITKEEEELLVAMLNNTMKLCNNLMYFSLIFREKGGTELRNKLFELVRKIKQADVEFMKKLLEILLVEEN